MIQVWQWAQGFTRAITYLRWSTPSTTSLPTSGNIAVSVSISASLGTRTVPAPFPLGLAAPASSETHCRTTPPVFGGSGEASPGSPCSATAPGARSVGVRAACARRVVLGISCRDRISCARVARALLVSGKTLFSLLPALSSPSKGLIQRSANLITLTV